MDLILIGKLMAMLENSSLDQLDVTEDGVRIRLSKTPTAGADAADRGPRSGTPEAHAESEIAALLALRGQPGGAETHVTAGLPGTFYRAPAPGEQPYAEEGMLVEEGQTLGLIEAMKMLNPVEAPVSGRLAAFLVQDATPVETGKPLILIEPAD